MKIGSTWFVEAGEERVNGLSQNDFRIAHHMWKLDNHIWYVFICRLPVDRSERAGMRAWRQMFRCPVKYKLSSWFIATRWYRREKHYTLICIIRQLGSYVPDSSGKGICIEERKRNVKEMYKPTHRKRSSRTDSLSSTSLQLRDSNQTYTVGPANLTFSSTSCS